MKYRILSTLLVLSSLTATANNSADIAKKLQNRVADMISVPVQFNYDRNIGQDEQSERWLTNVQPVVPYDLNDDWNLISRTIIPIVAKTLARFVKKGLAI